MNKFQWGRFHAEFAWSVTPNLKNWRKRNQVLGVLLLAVGDLQVFSFKDFLFHECHFYALNILNKLVRRALQLTSLDYNGLNLEDIAGFTKKKKKS